MNFYIGQEVVCIKSHSQNYVIKDKSYVIQNIRTMPCGCVNIDVGITDSNYNATNCIKHKTTERKYNNECWIYYELFIPIDHLNAKQVTWEQIIKDVPCYAN